MGHIGCAETSVTTGIRCVTTQKSEDLNHTTAEASNHAAVIKLLTSKEQGVAE